VKFRPCILLVGLLATVGAVPYDFGDLHYRWLGPAVMGGRLDAVAGVAGDSAVIYAGHSSGGLWKSSDGGLTFASVFQAGATTAIGAIAVDARRPRTVYIGTGEAFPRNTAAYGDGVYRSDDGAKTWTHLGLRDSGSIAKIGIDPHDDRIVLVAALGHEFGPNTQRGIYRSGDAGAHFTRVLFVNPTTGGSDLAFDSRRRGVVYAGTFDFLRRPWMMRSGGSGSAIWKSYDSGKTWHRLSGSGLHNGLPDASMNRAGVAVCASDSSVYAFAPTGRSMLYRSTDGGAHWRLRHASTDINFRPFYFSQVRCDPRDSHTVYAVGGALMVSRDGGVRFHDAGGGGDNHDLWIDPSNPNRLIDGSDMGLHLSLNGGKSWNYDNIVPFAQVYRVGYDYADPYHVMGGMQDHEVWWGPSDKRNLNDGVSDGDWRNIADWGDGQYAMADPRNPNLVYEDTHFGDLALVNIATGERRYISPQPLISFGTGARTYPYRFNWSAPLLVSRFDPDVVYFGGNVLFRTHNRGASWETVTPDLTHCDPSQLGRSGGPITYDNTNAETYCTIYSIAEDARDRSVLYIGTDNGHLDVTRDGGKTWTDVIGNVPGLPAHAWVNAIAASPTTSGAAYAAFDRHQFDDLRAYAYRTDDYGATWHPISHGLPSYVHVVRQDPRNANVLYAGTQTGVSVSLDGGASWRDFRLGIAPVPVFDLAVHPRDNDLIVGTHGRGFYVLDDLAPVQQLSIAASQNAFLFTPPVATRYSQRLYTEHGRGAFLAANKPYGALLSFYLGSAPPAQRGRKPTVHFDVFDGTGTTVASLERPAHAGVNRTSWDLRADLPWRGAITQDRRAYYIFYPLRLAGAEVPPGTYTVHLSANGTTRSQPLVVRMDPREAIDVVPLKARDAAVNRLLIAQERAEADLARVFSLRSQIAKLRRRSGGLLPRALVTLDGRLAATADLLRNADSSGYRAPARVVEQLAYLRYTIEQYDGAPTDAQSALIESDERESIRVDAALQQLVAAQLPPLNAWLTAHALAPLR